jgi:hypothetical protein
MDATGFRPADVAFFTRSSEKSVHQWRAGVGPDPRLRRMLRELLQTHEGQFRVMRDAIETLNKSA